MDKKVEIARTSVIALLEQNGYTAFLVPNFDRVVDICTGYYIVTLSSIIDWIQNKETERLAWAMFERIITNVVLTEAQTDMLYNSTKVGIV